MWRCEELPQASSPYAEQPRNRYGVVAAGSPVNLPGPTNQVTVTITIGDHGGTTAVNAIPLP
jgi:hypothetical protein